VTARPGTGQSLSDYAIALALIALAIAVAILLLGGQVSHVLSNVSGGV
jgi:Flp pilus assembly pilin Flp